MRAICRLLLVAVPLSFAAAPASAGQVRSVEEFARLGGPRKLGVAKSPHTSPETTHQTIARSLYEAAEQTLRLSGHDVDLYVTNVHVLTETRLRKANWNDLFTPYPSVELKTARELSNTSVRYTAEWRARAEPVEGSEDPEFTASDAWTTLELLRRKDESLWGAEKLYGLWVHLRFAGQSVDYRAMLGVMRVGKDKAPRYFVIDPVVHGVGFMAGEDPLTVGQPLFDSLRQVHDATTVVTSNACQEELGFFESPSVQRIAGFEDHSAGSHAARLQLKGRCWYKSDCGLECYALNSDRQCLDVGYRESGKPANHVAIMESEVPMAYGWNRLVTCGAAVGCLYYKYLPFNPITFDILWYGTSAFVQLPPGTSGYLWHGAVSDVWTCPAPLPVRTVEGAEGPAGGPLAPFSPSPNPLPPNLGGGAAGPGPGCSWSCVWIWNWIEEKYEEECTLRC